MWRCVASGWMATTGANNDVPYYRLPTPRLVVIAHSAVTTLLAVSRPPPRSPQHPHSLLTHNEVEVHPTTPTLPCSFMMMIFASLASLLLLAVPALGQGDISAAHNLTSLVATWSSGSRKVITGSVSSVVDRSFSLLLTSDISPLGFCQPQQPVFYLPSYGGSVVFLVSSICFCRWCALLTTFFL